MKVVNQGIVSIPVDIAKALYTHSKETILFYVLTLCGDEEEDIKNSLNLSEEDIKGISAYLAKKKLIEKEKTLKKEKKTYNETIREQYKKILDEKPAPEDFSREARAKVILGFYLELTGKTVTTDRYEILIQKKLAQATIQQLVEAIWRNHHNVFCNGGGRDKWKWGLDYLMRPETDKSQPLEKSLARILDIPVADKSVEALKNLIGAFPAFHYIKTIPCKYETLRPSDHAAAEQEVLRQQREIKSKLGIGIEDL